MEDAMRKAIVIVAATLFVGTGLLASSAQAKNPCAIHKDNAACSADKACGWNAQKNKCQRAKK
jgi:hypothetical protein